MKVVIVTNVLYPREPEYIRYTDEIKRRYCEKHDMTYLRMTSHPHRGMHPVFSKFHVILTALKGDYDWVIWMDCDAAPVNMDVDIKKFLEERPGKVIMLKDALGWNAGVFAVPNNQRAVQWMEWCDKQENMIRFDRAFRDQDEMAYTFKTTYADFVRDDGYDFGFNHYDDIYSHKEKPNLFVEGKSWCLHCPGISDDYRNDRFNNILRAMDGLPPMRKIRKESLDGKTATDYVKEGAKSILIDYPHGLGDLIMFMPFAKEFARQNPHITVDVRPHQAFKSLLPDTDGKTYDVELYFPARFNEATPGITQYTKPEVNARFDLGIDYNPDLEYSEPLVPPMPGRKNSKMVGVNFCCTSFPLESNCPEQTGFLIWNTLVENGFIPVETFAPKYNRPENRRYQFVRWSMRDVGLGIDRMMSLMSSLKGMAAVGTASWHYGMAAYPETTMYLQNSFKPVSYTRKKVLALNVNRPDIGVINEWISRLKDKEL